MTVRVIARRVYRKVNIVDTMFKMLEKYSTDLEEIVRVRTIALEEERKKTENLLSQMLPAFVASTALFLSLHPILPSVDLLNLMFSCRLFRWPRLAESVL